MVITSVKNERIKELVKLKDKKYRDKMGLFFIEGLDIIDEAYKSGVLKCIYVLDGYDNPYGDIPCIYVSYDVMKKISDMESISEYYGVCEKIDNDKVGDRVIYSKYAGTEVKLEDDEYIVVKQSDIVAIVED